MYPNGSIKPENISKMDPNEVFVTTTVRPSLRHGSFKVNPLGNGEQNNRRCPSLAAMRILLYNTLLEICA